MRRKLPKGEKERLAAIWLRCIESAAADPDGLFVFVFVFNIFKDSQTGK